ncbi:MAG: hypothetical protein L3J26_11040, partial [Candidatus Polarisedimenticolaceae bacterium]|nr:hypothetical protein [Candidatus Polarisedimenticolaceae bacterium]
MLRHLLCFKLSDGRFHGLFCQLCGLFLSEQRFLALSKVAQVSRLSAPNGCQSGVITRQFKRLAGKPEFFLLGSKGIYPGLQIILLLTKLLQLLLKPGNALKPGDRPVLVGNLSVQFRILVGLLVQRGSKLLFILFTQKLHTVEFRLQGVEPVAFLRTTLMDAHRDSAINLRARYLLQNGRSITRICFQKGVKATLGKQHGTGET